MQFSLEEIPETPPGCIRKEPSLDDMIKSTNSKTMVFGGVKLENLYELLINDSFDVLRKYKNESDKKGSYSLFGQLKMNSCDHLTYDKMKQEFEILEGKKYYEPYNQYEMSSISCCNSHSCDFIEILRIYYVMMVGIK